MILFPSLWNFKTRIFDFTFRIFPDSVPTERQIKLSFVSIWNKGANVPYKRSLSRTQNSSSAASSGFSKVVPETFLSAGGARSTTPPRHVQPYKVLLLSMMTDECLCNIQLSKHSSSSWWSTACPRFYLLLWSTAVFPNFSISICKPTQDAAKYVRNFRMFFSQLSSVYSKRKHSFRVNEWMNSYLLIPGRFSAAGIFIQPLSAHKLFHFVSTSWYTSCYATCYASWHASCYASWRRKAAWRVRLAANQKDEKFF